MTSRLYRPRRDQVVGGVCSGLGLYFGIDPAIVRLVFVILAVAGGAGVPLYIVLWLVMPAEDRLGAAPQSVVQENAAEMGQRVADRGTWTNVPRERTIWAAIGFIVLGILLLINNVFGLSLGDFLFPVVLIVLGIILVTQAMKRG
jgi:phage shock protein C